MLSLSFLGYKKLGNNQCVKDLPQGGVYTSLIHCLFSSKIMSGKNGLSLHDKSGWEFYTPDFDVGVHCYKTPYILGSLFVLPEDNGNLSDKDPHISDFAKTVL